MGGLASVLLAAGAVGAYIADNDLASVTLILVGAVLSLVALTGLVPTRLRWGDREVQLAILQDAQAAYSSGAEEQAERIALDLLRDPSRTSLAAMTWGSFDKAMRSQVRGEVYEREVLSVIGALVSGDVSVDVPTDAELSRLDAVVQGRDRRIGIEIRRGTRFDVNLLLDRMASILAYALPRLDGLLVVVQTDPDDAALARLQQATNKLDRPVSVVAWRPGDATDTLEAALRELLGASTASATRAARRCRRE